MKKKLLCSLFALLFLLSLFPILYATGDTVQPGTSFTYTQEEHWGKSSDIWSWQWRLAGGGPFQDMVFTNISGQGDCYVADWELYPYCAARWGGNNVHSNTNADAARVFTAPASGSVSINITIARTGEFTSPTGNTPTSFQILLNDTIIYPSEENFLILTSTTQKNITVTAKVRAGEKLRFVVGSMGNHNSDAVNMITTVTYESVGDPGDQRIGQTYTFAATNSTWGQDTPLWSWEWTPKNGTSFSPMTYQYVASYGKNMYVADWNQYPYCYVDMLGTKMHPGLDVDTVKTFSAPYSGTIRIDTSIARFNQYVAGGNQTPTSLRILVNNTQVYPLYSNVLSLTSTDAKDFSISVPVQAGDKIRFVIGGMDQIDADAVQNYNTITYISLEAPALRAGDAYTFSASQSTWGTPIEHWSWEWHNQTSNTFHDMTYQYISSYGKYMYAADWSTYPYCYADLLGVKVHPAKNADTVKTFTAPYSGRVEITTMIARAVSYNASSAGSKTPTSLQIFKNNEQIWPTNGNVVSLTSTDQITYKVSANIQVGDKIRFVIGSMGQQDEDAVMMYNTVTYRTVGPQQLAMVTDQANARISVYDIHADNWEANETVWSWAPSTANGFTLQSAFAYCTDAKLRYAPNLRKYVVAVSASNGFLGIADYATGQKIWEVNATGSANPHSIEYLPNGNIAAAASNGGWIRIYTASQNSTAYVQANLQGAHGVLWDPQRNLLWAVGDLHLTAYRIGGTAANPTITEASEYRKTLPGNGGGHDLSAVYGDGNRLWITDNSATYQYDIAAETFQTTYIASEVLNRFAVKGISSYKETNTAVTTIPNNTFQSWNTDRVEVTIPVQNGTQWELYGRTQTHSTGAFYKVRSWISDYR